jgi:hypothetical protein
MQAFLKKHAPGPALHTVKVNWSREGRVVTVDFQVQKRSSAPWLADPAMTMDYKRNWGLWNQDVVEAFLQLRQHDDDIKAAYLEIQVSPLNQPLALVIIEPRKTFHAPEELKFEHTVTVEGRSFSGQMKVTLPDEIKGEKLFGGCFACLSENPREYFALNPNPESNPDFHRPELFIGLDE